MSSFSCKSPLQHPILTDLNYLHYPNDLNCDIYFLDSLHDENITNDDADNDHKEDDVDDNLQYHNTAILKFDFIEVSCFVGLKPPSQVFYSFYLVKIMNKYTAQKYVPDIHGHSIQEGQPYFVGAYYEKSKETLKYVFYKPPL